jgi:hypothetical protein
MAPNRVSQNDRQAPGLESLQHIENQIVALCRQAQDSALIPIAIGECMPSFAAPVANRIGLTKAHHAGSAALPLVSRSPWRPSQDGNVDR